MEIFENFCVEARNILRSLRDRVANMIFENLKFLPLILDFWDFQDFWTRIHKFSEISNFYDPLFLIFFCNFSIYFFIRSCIRRLAGLRPYSYNGENEHDSSKIARNGPVIDIFKTSNSFFGHQEYLIYSSNYNSNNNSSNFCQF